VWKTKKERPGIITGHAKRGCALWDFSDKKQTVKQLIVYNIHLYNS